MDRLNRAFNRFQDRVALGVQNPIRLSPCSDPQPDLALLELPLERYSSAPPAPGDVLLVVEDP